MRTRVRQWGNSLAIRIPQAYAKDLRMDAGSEVELALVDGSLVVVAVEDDAVLASLLAQVTPSNIHGEAEFGEPVGRETW